MSRGLGGGWGREIRAQVRISVDNREAYNELIEFEIAMGRALLAMNGIIAMMRRLGLPEEMDAALLTMQRAIYLMQQLNMVMFAFQNISTMGMGGVVLAGLGAVGMGINMFDMMGY